ncbi:MAG TPA: NUDIX domain-containing protein [Candidatus Saccharimonadales bacterium]
MERLLTVQDSDFEPNTPRHNRSSFFRRRAARAVVLDHLGAVGLMYVSSEKYFKLPGGGIDKGEAIKSALKRELLEELGCHVEILKELGEILEYRDYWEMIQTSYAYLVRVVGKKGQPQLTDLERSQGFEVAWQKDIEAAIRALEQQQPQGGSHPLAHRFMQARDITILKKANKL